MILVIGCVLIFLIFMVNNSIWNFNNKIDYVVRYFCSSCSIKL